MKIAILSTIYPASILPQELVARYGLQQKYDNTGIHNLVETLVLNGKNEIHLISICSEFESDFSYTKNGVVYDFVKPHSKPLRATTHFEADKRKIHSFLKDQDFDIVHGQGLPGPGYFAATSALPHVTTIHIYNHSFKKIFDYHIKSKTRFSSWYFGLLRIRQELVSLNKTRNFICSSPLIEKKLLEKKYKGKLFTIDNAVSSIFFDKQREQEGKFGLFIGSIQDRKSIIELLEATQKTKQKKIKIISQTTSGVYYDKVLNYINKSKLSRHVELCGPKRNIEIIQILRESAFLVLPSKKEGAPIVIGEAMAAGKPVIATAVDGVPYMIKDGETGFLVPPGDSQKLAEKMELLFSDSALCQKMGKKAQQEAKKRWHPDVVAEQTIKVYQDIIQNWGKGSVK